MVLFAYYTPFRVAGCGNGTRVAPEGCDDGNVGDGDGCSSSCQIEVGFPGCMLVTDCVPAARCEAGTCVARCLSDASCNDSNACTVDSCSVAGSCVNVPVLAGATGACAAGLVCSGAPTNLCVQCLTNTQCSGATPLCNTLTNTCVGCLAATDCNDSNDCTSDACTLNACVNIGSAIGTACAGGVCNATSMCVGCVDDALAMGTDSGCSAAAPMCAPGGVCVGCINASDCADTNPCTVEACTLGMCEVDGVEAGMMGMCAASTVCSGPAGTTPNSCVQCATNAQCSGATAFCDAATNTCGPCTADFGGTGAACAEATPFCALTGATMGICGRCTSNTDCVGHAGGALCDLVSGSCGTACNIDADCSGTEWCPASRVCAPKVANGMSVPTAGPANGMCTTEIGTRTCISAVCFEADDLCGLPNGEACTLAGVCRSAICAPNGACGACDADEDCTEGRVCNVPTGLCVMTDAGMSMRDSGPRTLDAGREDVGSLFIDAGPGTDTNTGGIAGGACGCAVNTTKSANGLLAMLGLLGLAVTRRRRR